MKELNPNPLSLVPVFLGMFLEETKQQLASGTGFIYKYDEKLYLITNWHNVTGLNPSTKRPLSSHGGVPNILTLGLLVKNSKPTEWRNFHINLYDSDGKAEWFIHPIHKELVDVIAIEIEFSEDFEGIFKPINDLVFNEFEIQVADDVFILGYPLSMTGGGLFPIWKKGSIATEPEIDYERLPKFLVDASSKQGMSGSPVIMRKNGVHFNEISDSIFGTIQNFIGIYSGRIISSQNKKCNCPKCKDGNCTVDHYDTDSQLGIVWKKNVIEEIIKGKVKGEQNGL